MCYTIIYRLKRANPLKGVFDIFEREKIGDGIWFGKVTDSRYKINHITISFFTGFKEENYADHAVVPYILTDSNKHYPDNLKLNTKLAELYAASLGGNIQTIGDLSCNMFTCGAIDDSYAFYGEKLNVESCKMLLSCLLEPITENGAFSEKMTGRMKGELMDAIDNVINDKRSYAAQRGSSYAYKGEAAAYSDSQGTHELAEKITPASAYSAYKNMLEHGRIEITAVGCGDFAEAKEMFGNAFSKIKRSGIYPLTSHPSMLKPEPLEITENLPMKQAVVRMYFKAPELTDRFAGTLLGIVLGGTSTSRFFTNIREKQSLCYYCSGYSNRFLRSFTAYAGVDPENIEKIREAILSEFRNVLEHGVTEDELELAKKDLINSARAIFDNVVAVAPWYQMQLFNDEIFTPEEYIERVKEVTAKRVKDACELYSLDTFYTLRPSEEKTL